MPQRVVGPDAEIKREVERVLAADVRLSHGHIGVAVDRGAVALTGQVPTYGEKLLAEKLVFRVPRVTAIADRLRVAVLHGHSDIDIARAASKLLTHSVNIPVDSVHVIVEAGVLTLRGSLSWNFQREAAVRSLRHIEGVTDIRDETTLEHRSPNIDATHQVMAAFQRSATLRDRGIEATVEGGVVTLTGVVHSWNEQRDAIRIAWSSPGVTSVVSRLETRYSGDAALSDLS